VSTPGLPGELRWVDAGNAGPFTLEGTRTHIVGRRLVAVVDPGPALAAHVAAVAAEVEQGGAESVVIAVTHGHADHVDGAAALAERLGAVVVGAWGAGDVEGGASAWEGGGAAQGQAGPGGPPPGLPFRALAGGEGVATDAGDLIAIATAGHARAHLAFHWPARAAVFVGDLLLGRGETTWVGAYPGCVADYLASLDRVEGLAPRLLLPTHGGPVLDPIPHIQRYRAHRLGRIAQVERALSDRPFATLDELVVGIYGTGLPREVVQAARASVAALVEHVGRSG
jgi:glyoxylase-like metal-dependent hydrolase (beta-lactamase superfamily II)